MMFTFLDDQEVATFVFDPLLMDRVDEPLPAIVTFRPALTFS